MVILLPLAESVDSLRDLSERLPALDLARPRKCPGCGHLAHQPGERLGIVGHGSYQRQVLGVPCPEPVLIRVRRFVCLGCRGTISALPDLLHPGRWWCAWAILRVLALHLLEGRTEKEVRAEFDVEVEGPSWRTPRRWRRQLLDRLWLGWSAALGSRGPARTRAAGQTRLRRLLRQTEGWDETEPGQVGAAGVRELASRVAPGVEAPMRTE
jgi:hypothetical protein